MFNNLTDAVENAIFYNALATLDLETCYEMLDAYIRGELTDYLIDEGINPLDHITNIICGILKKDIEAVTIPKNIENIGNSAFSYCSSLTNIKISNSVTSIGSYAFSNCDSLTSIVIPDSIISIGNNAFWWCGSLTTVSFEENSQLRNIGDSAFYSCSKLTSIVIPNSVTSIGDFTFCKCDKLTSIKYLGTKSEALNKLRVKNKKWRYGSAISKIICTDGEIDL